MSAARLPGLGPTVTGKIHSGKIHKGDKISCRLAGKMLGDHRSSVSTDSDAL